MRRCLQLQPGLAPPQSAPSESSPRSRKRYPCVFLLQGVHGEEVVLEAQVAPARDDNTSGGVRFSVTVLETASGPLALPPTELTTYDVEVDIREAFLDMHRAMYKFQVIIAL